MSLWPSVSVRLLRLPSDETPTTTTMSRPTPSAPNTAPRRVPTRRLRNRFMSPSWDRGKRGLPGYSSDRPADLARGPHEPARRAARPVRAPLAGVMQQPGGAHVAPEVGGVDRLAAQRHVEPLCLPEREAPWAQPPGDAPDPPLVGPPRAQPPQPVLDDPRVIERQRRRTRRRVPARVAPLRAALRQRLGRHERHVRNHREPAPRIALGVGVGA